VALEPPATRNDGISGFEPQILTPKKRHGLVEIRTQDLRRVKPQNPHLALGLGAGHKYEESRENDLSSLQLTFRKQDLDDFTRMRTARLSPKSLHWIYKSSELFWNITQGTINQATISAVSTHATTEYHSRDSWSKILNFARSFLRYLTKVRFDFRYTNFDLFLEAPKVLKERKTVTSRIVTIDDIRNVIATFSKAHRDGNLDEYRYSQFIAITLFGAYTGQRFESTISRLTVRQFREALNAEPAVLHVQPSQDKIRMEHYVPLHTALHPILGRLLEDRDDNDRMFTVVPFRLWTRRNKISLTRTAKHFVPGDLRKFAEQYGDVIGWDQSNRAYILTHGVSDVAWSHYKHPLPENVFEIYMRCWDEVYFTTEECILR
jgi:hypothetical protein